MPGGILRSAARWSFAAACCLTAFSLWAAAPPVSATLVPPQISMGESAQLTITTAGNGMDAVTLPKVAGLEFRVVGQTRRVEIINGATLSTTSVIVRVVPQAAGIFSIPGITAQPLLLRVNPDNGSGSSPYGTSNEPRRPPVVASGPTANGIKLTADGAAFVRMNLPKRDVYVGESIPVEIEVGMRAGMVTSVNGLPTLNNSDFTLNNLSHQPERIEKVIDGQHFTLLTWHSVLAPVKPGTFPLSVETPLTVRVRIRPQRDSSIDDLLGDPFMQNFFGATVPKDIKVSSQTNDLKVLPLPTEDRPRDFSGAVGSFKIASDVSAPHAVVGDPLTLRLKISGAGNFDRVETPMLEKLDQWKTYPPKSSFAPGDAVGYKGEKTFEQPLIAARPGAQTLPPLTFSYFDPTTRRYETARANPVGVTITASAADSASAAPLTAANDGTAANPAATSMRADHAAPGPTTTSLVPLYFQPRFLALPSMLALLFAGGWAVRRRTDPRARGGRAGRDRQRRLSKDTQRLLEQMARAAAAGQPAPFFAHARSAVQSDLAARWEMPLQEITAAEIETRLGAAGTAGPGPDVADLVEIFALADEANYAGRSTTATDFARWTQVVRELLAAEKAT